MNEKFFSLPEEKQLQIINAATEVFAKYDYKHASTDLIASKAGISKGLLFYYFHNKKELYLYLFTYLTQIITQQVVDNDFTKITDFFELLEYSASKKAEILQKNPYVLDFAVKSFYSEKEEVSDKLQDLNYGQQDAIFQQYLGHVDTFKFKDNCNFYDIFKMLVWMTDGYLHELRVMKKTLDVAELKAEYHKWVTMFRKLFYKEEYL